jgi:hypothetical protein
VWKREEDEMELEMSAGFSVREEDEADGRAEIDTSRKLKVPEWDGLEMDMDMD